MVHPAAPMPAAGRLREWLTTVDHKRIGISYCVTAFVFFVIGGLEALAIRLQLAQPDGQVLDAASYNQFFTMHGLTMIFLVVRSEERRVGNGGWWMGAQSLQR